MGQGKSDKKDREILRLKSEQYAREQRHAARESIKTAIEAIQSLLSLMLLMDDGEWEEYAGKNPAISLMPVGSWEDWVKKLLDEASARLGITDGGIAASFYGAVAEITLKARPARCIDAIVSPEQGSAQRVSFCPSVKDRDGTCMRSQGDIT